MANYAFIPYLGNTIPSDRTWTGGVISHMANVRIGCWNTSGELTPVFAFSLSTGGWSGGYMSLSPGYCVKNTSSSGDFFLESIVSFHGISIYEIRFNESLSNSPRFPLSLTESVTLDEAYSIVTNYGSFPITYRDTNAISSGPAEAAVGDTVTVEYTFPDGYGIVNSSDIYVTNNGVLIPSTYADGTLTFTMPDPS